MQTNPPSRLSWFSRARLRSWVRRLGAGLLGLLLVLMGLWAALALYFADTHGGGRTLWAVLFVLASLAAVGLIRPRRLGLAVFGALFAAVLVWFCLLQPSNDRDWGQESAQLAWATVEGDQLTVHNVRHFEYRTPTDFTPQWEERHYDLAQLRGMDLMLAYWGSPALAHAMVSFEFEDGRFLAVSVEIRREQSEAYSPLQGLFRQYEKIFVFADERDVVRLRSEFRQEEVFLYRTIASPKQARSILLSCVAGANQLKDRPEFYNSLAGNCATTLVKRIQEAGLTAQVTWQTLLSGYADRYMYAHGSIDTRLPFAQLRARSQINAASHTAGNGEDFSLRMRQGLPEPAKVE